ncbi:hypothetical protein SKAU_G00039280 [Synaphobranchus kaupii]|uniref:Uncharacterized protein n=1 Tax=Synaphobranchus kaupii TaxID=118154 RepID=A0A9Q1GFD8_SYNKA|nr:hypothetical protein SKAU_G00039280 [Synaphobranchus kaupii]
MNSLSKGIYSVPKETTVRVRLVLLVRGGCSTPVLILSGQPINQWFQVKTLQRSGTPGTLKCWKAMEEHQHPGIAAPVRQSWGPDPRPHSL